MELSALETHIRISRNLKKFLDLMRNRGSGPEPSSCLLQSKPTGADPPPNYSATPNYGAEGCPAVRII